ncbi:hypothetical protein RHMOL_Rhmol04G0077100 [Rhododendron molle]|uniref:Uncharacterized protein n=1 Tax=Rhododendron molle TaxID=49168 RepID=A0ACC0P0K3_RHOML|nr:hypothetical protein RHMOL_Rhmol04G0077100 [Rhododendron molle]
MFPYLLSIAVPLYFFLHQSTLTLAINSPGLYSQQLDYVAVNCGSSGNSTAEDSRQWTGDARSNYITSLHGSKSKSKATDQPLPYDPIPYATARLSPWPFTYTFRVTPGQKLIRLHFYPASYRGGFKRSEAFFTVKAGPYTLLSNFSASLAVDALGLPSLVKEYCVNVDEDQPLIITFSPSRIGNSDEVYAFVNGIEIISMPAALYHTHEGNPAAKIIGKSDRFTIDKSIALEKVHRLNVGGSSISSIEDTGMFRDWYEDSNYLLEKSSVEPVTTTIRIKYMSIPPYSAPQKVYQTSWSLVPDKQANKTESNLTWRLPVDLGFRYLLRLHFCGLEYEIKEIGRVEFSIFVNEQVVEAKVDLIQWSGGNGVAVFKDYVVIMDGDRLEGKRDLLIALRPQNHEWMEPIDATLKGLEVFKLSNTDKNLAGVNPVPLACTSTSPKPKKLVFASGGKAIATGVVIVLTVLNVIVFQLRSLSENRAGRTFSLSPSEGLCRRFSLAELMSVTNNFNDEFVIGSGGFGKVYKALIDDDATTVALKRCNLKSQGAKEFWTEIEMLSKLRHTHLVSLLGYCDERNEMILVYEFMEHGTLADRLYKTKTKGNGMVGYMSWEQRLHICVGAARGLDYLHTGIRHGIIHRDVKTTNILLDKDWIAKISDFGLCKVGSTSHSHTYVSTDVKGTMGYLDPEYYMTRRLTKKSDVYAFGVVMLEILCGRKAVDTQLDEEQHSLVLWAKQCIKENKLDQLIDPSLRDQISAHCLKVFAEVANNCLDSRSKGRPTMADVVVRLENTLASERAVHEQFGENTQGRNRSKVNVTKVFQRTIEFLAKGADIKWKKGKTNSQSKGKLKHRDIEDWMRHCQLPEDLKLRVRRFVQNKRLATQRVDEETILSRLPSDLRRDIQRHVHLDVVQRELLQRKQTNDFSIGVGKSVEFSYEELAKATNDFSNGHKIGQGGFGAVYYAELRGEKAAIKKMDMRATREFLVELNVLTHVHHLNLVRLIGYCVEGSLFLVYEYIENGNLSQHVHGTEWDPLPWSTRVQIALDSARGLEYIHEHTVPVYIHRDIKTANILIDKNFRAKVADFGLTKLTEVGGSSMPTRLVGTFGYMPPEYAEHGVVSPKIDVYAFGVVLYELISAKEAIVKARNPKHDSKGLVALFEDVLNQPDPREELRKLVDPRLGDSYPIDLVRKLAQLAKACTQENPLLRPSMRSAVVALMTLSSSTED